MPPTVLLAPGASGTVAGLRRYVTALRDAGIPGRTVQLPKGSVERALPVYRAVIARAAPSASGLVIGGHSFGGRVASLLAADDASRLSGLLLLSYPLHRPGHAEQWRDRTDHWPRVKIPVLLLSGESDPFARIEVLREATRRLAHAELVTYPGVRHGIGPVFEDAMRRISPWVLSLGT